MYTQFYGLREKPFSLTPDPRYLYLAESHREALAHLLYAIEQGEGFTAVTGEVGTGKTTLCRTLLQRLDPGTEVAFIFNPQLSPDELLQAICSELGLETEGRSRRELHDSLNEFLLAKKTEGRKVLLILDEAQNLPFETLEQIRMLSNLETDTQKLVQIVLIGQPELDAMLESPRLRQLRQRISVRWRLQPLSAGETRDYVRHRLRIAAGAPREVFTELALREVHRRSDGIPRVINLLCDRALLAGYASGASSIGLGLVAQTQREIRGGKRLGGAATRTRRRGRRVALAALTFTTGVALALLAGPVLLPFATDWLSSRRGAPAVAAAPPVQPSASAPAAAAPAPASIPEPASGSASASASAVAEPELPTAAPASPERPAAAVASTRALAALELDPGEARSLAALEPPAAAAAPEPAPPAARGTQHLLSEAALGRAVARTAQGVAWARATAAALERFGAPPLEFDVIGAETARARLAAAGIQRLPLREASFAVLSFLDRPTLLPVRGSDGTERTLLLVALEGDEVELVGLDSGPVRVSAEALSGLLTGDADVLWRDHESLPPLLVEGSSGSSVAWLQYALGRLGYYSVPPTGSFDEETAEAVRRFQRARQLRADGTVGPLTKMALYEALGDYTSPVLEPRSTAVGEARG